MKRTIFLILLLPFLSFLNVAAQTDTADHECPFSGNWYLSVGAGPQVLFSADAERLSFSNRLTPDFSLSAGKWFNPNVGMRVKIQGFKLNGYSTPSGLYIADPREGNIPFGNDDPVRDYVMINPDGSYRHTIQYLNAHMDFRLSLFSLFGHNDEVPAWDIIPGAGFGYMHVFDYEGLPASSFMTSNFSLAGKYRISERFDLAAEIHSSLFPDQFDGRITGQVHEFNLGLNLGISWHFGKQGFKKDKPAAQVVNFEPKEVEVQLVRDTVFIEKTKYVEVEQGSFQPFTLGSILFDINSLSPRKDQDIVFINIAEYLRQHPGKKVRLDAFTDKTGSENFNKSLSKGRAGYVKGLLVDEYGVNPEQVVENPVGSDEQPYERKDWNRVVVVRTM